MQRARNCIGSYGFCACTDGSRCGYFDDNPEDGTLSFDSVGAACIAILQAFTFDTWTDPMCALMDAVSRTNPFHESAIDQ